MYVKHCILLDKFYNTGMRRIKKKELEKAGKIYCPFCKPEKVIAVWRKDNRIDLRYDVACEKHKEKMVEVDDSRLTEADYQSWNKFYGV